MEGHGERMTDTMDLADVAQVLARGASAAMLVRHAARFPIPKDDPSFGGTVALTEEGEAMARQFGRRLAGITDDVGFWASPMRRCRDTAAGIAAGMGLVAECRDADAVGLYGCYYSDPVRLQKQMQAEGHLPVMLRYLERGEEPYHHPLADGTAALTRWIGQTAVRRLNIFVSHDIFCAAYAVGLGLRTFTGDDWAGFMQGVLLVREPDATTWTAHWFVPERADRVRLQGFVD